MSQFERWPFEEQSYLYEERWWQECFRARNDFEGMRSHSRWILIYGGAQSGKSVTLAAILRELNKENKELICEYPLSDWPVDENSNHLTQLMRVASGALMGVFKKEPDKINQLSPSQKEFLRWLIEKFNKPRTLTRFLDSLKQEYDVMLREIAYSDLYPSQTEQQDVEDQIGELISFCGRIEYEKITFWVDVPVGLNKAQKEQLANLYQWLSLIQIEGLRVIAVVPDQLVREGDLLKKMRGRVRAYPLTTDREHAIQAVNQHLTAATGGKITCLAEIAEETLVNPLERLICEQYGCLAIGAWVGIALLLLEKREASDKILDEGSLASICKAFFSQHCPLRLGRGGVWRGEKFIELEEAQFELAEKLWEAKEKGQPAVDYRVMRLSKENMHTRIRRLRKEIEPVKEVEIYLLSQRNEGYWFA